MEKACGQWWCSCPSFLLLRNINEGAAVGLPGIIIISEITWGVAGKPNKTAAGERLNGEKRTKEIHTILSLSLGACTSIPLGTGLIF